MTTGKTHLLSYHDLSYPWQSAPTPHAAEIEATNRQWVLDSRLLRSDEINRLYDPLNIGLLTSLTYPRASSERLLILARLLAWIFVQDDHYDNVVISLDLERRRRMLDIYAEVMQRRAPVPGASRAAGILGEIVQQIAALTTPSWLDRFASSMCDFWLNGVIAETRCRIQGIVLDLHSYMEMRIHSIAVLPVLVLIEFSQAFELPDYVAEDPALVQLWKLTARIMMCVNDILSYQKERDARDPNNLIHVLMHHENISLPEAVDKAVRMHDEDLMRFNTLTQELPSWEPAISVQVSRYLEGHRAWMRGALDWQLFSYRYATGRDYLEILK